MGDLDKRRGNCVSGCLVASHPMTAGVCKSTPPVIRIRKAAWHPMSPARYVSIFTIRLPRASALGLARPGLDGRKRRLNGIGRAQVNPVLGGKSKKVKYVAPEKQQYPPPTACWRTFPSCQ